MKRPLTIALVLGVLLLILISVGYQQADRYLQKEINSRTAASFSDVSKGLTDQITNLTNSVSELKGELTFYESLLAEVHADEASVNTDGSGYGVAQTQQGAFLVIASSATPYLDGYKVHLEIGNMTTATINGAKISVEWGLQYGDKTKTFQEIAASKHKQVFDVTTTFYPGAYSATDVVLSPAKAEEVKIIDVGLAFNALELRKAAN